MTRHEALSHQKVSSTIDCQIILQQLSVPFMPVLCASKNDGQLGGCRLKVLIHVHFQPLSRIIITDDYDTGLGSCEMFKAGKRIEIA